MPNTIFVFGSNEGGYHGAGAARTAKLRHGARHAQGYGPMGNSFAIPTKDWEIKSLSIETIQFYVDRFLEYVRQNMSERFQITAIGCGLAGFKHQDIAPMFKDAPDNCYFDELWKEYLPGKKFWGTF